jgi:hypothetical protein
MRESQVITSQMWTSVSVNSKFKLSKHDQIAAVLQLIYKQWCAEVISHQFDETIA